MAADVVYGLCPLGKSTLPLNYGAAEAVATAVAVVNSLIDQRRVEVMLLEQFKQQWDVNTQSVQAVQQFVAVSDVLVETDIQVL